MFPCLWFVRGKEGFDSPSLLGGRWTQYEGLGVLGQFMKANWRSWDLNDNV